MSGLNPIFNPTRLEVCAFLSGCESADYAAVQDYCGLTQSTLSKSLTQLIDSDYVHLEKVAAGRYTKTVLSLTPTGRAALTAHLGELQRIAQDASQAAATTASKPRGPRGAPRTMGQHQA